jgi:hypothetical protein
MTISNQPQCCYLGQYIYKGFELEIYRNQDGFYNGKGKGGYYCYTNSQRDNKLKRAFQLWVNSLPEEAFTDKDSWIKNFKYMDYMKTEFVD